MRNIPARMLVGVSLLVAVLVIGATVLLVRPTQTQAVGGAADAVCMGCQNVDPSKPRYCKTIPCSDSTAGFGTNGFCITSGICLGQSTSGLNGFGLDKVAQILGPLMQALLKGSQNGSASPSDTSLPANCQPPANSSGVGAQLIASSSSSTPGTYDYLSSPCNTSGSTGASNLLGTPFAGAGANGLTSSLLGSNCTDPTACGFASIADQLKSGLDNLAPATSSSTSVSSTTPIRNATSTAAATTTMVSGYQGTGSNISPQGLTLERSASTVIFIYAPVGENSQIAGFISCNVTGANAVPYIPLSAIQNACR